MIYLKIQGQYQGPGKIDDHIWGLSFNLYWPLSKFKGKFMAKVKFDVWWSIYMFAFYQTILHRENIEYLTLKILGLSLTKFF